MKTMEFEPRKIGELLKIIRNYKSILVAMNNI